MLSASIVVPSRDRPAKLARVINSIQQTTSGLGVEIIAILDIPDEKSHDLVKSMGGIRVVTMPSHYVMGNSMRKWQAGYEAASCEWVVQSADDVVYDDGWLRAALCHHDDKAPVSGFVGLQSNNDSSGTASLFMATKTYIETVMNGHFGLPWYYANWADNEWTYRAGNAGALTFCGGASYTHLHYNYTGEPRDAVAMAAHQRHSLDQATFFARHGAGFPEDWPEVW